MSRDSVAQSATQRYLAYHHGCPPAPSDFPCDYSEHPSTVYPCDSCSQVSHSTTRSRSTSKPSTKATRSSKKKVKQPKGEVPPLPNPSQYPWAPPSSYQAPTAANAHGYMRGSLPPIVEHAPVPQGSLTSPYVAPSANALPMVPYQAPPPQSSFATGMAGGMAGVDAARRWEVSPYRGHYDQQLQQNSRWSEPPVYPDSRPDEFKERRVYEHLAPDGTVLRTWDERTVHYRPS